MGRDYTAILAKGRSSVTELSATLYLASYYSNLLILHYKLLVYILQRGTFGAFREGLKNSKPKNMNIK